MELAWFGRKQLVEALQNGFSPVPGYEYVRGEYAFLLVKDGAVRNLTRAEFIAWIINRPLIKPKPVKRSNASGAGLRAAYVNAQRKLGADIPKRDRPRPKVVDRVGA